MIIIYSQVFGTIYMRASSNPNKVILKPKLWHGAKSLNSDSESLPVARQDVHLSFPILWAWTRKLRVFKLHRCMNINLGVSYA